MRIQVDTMGRKSKAYLWIIKFLKQLQNINCHYTHQRVLRVLFLDCTGRKTNRGIYAYKVLLGNTFITTKWFVNLKSVRHFWGLQFLRPHALCGFIDQTNLTKNLSIFFSGGCIFLIGNNWLAKQVNMWESHGLDMKSNCHKALQSFRCNQGTVAHYL